MTHPVSAGEAGQIRTGALIVNADDWGQDRRTTDLTLECLLHGPVSAVSAMVFMEDSERAAGIAREYDADAGLHLNFTTPFTGSAVPAGLEKHQRKVSCYLRRHRLAQVCFHPGLIRSFEYVVSAQIEEYVRLYGAEPHRLDGHHHMHLCANVLLGALLPRGRRIRRNFSHQPGEKSLLNRLYRRCLDGLLARDHELPDFFFSLPPFEKPGRLPRIFALAGHSRVEVETHPACPDEHRFLLGEEMQKLRLNAGLSAASPPAGRVTPADRRKTAQ